MTDRVAIVTGASGGIGHAVAVRLAKAGMAVAVHYAGNSDRARPSPTRSSPRAAARSWSAPTSPTRPRSRRCSIEVEAEFGGVDVVVNTAGIMLLSPLTELNLDDFDRMHRTNVRGTFVVSQQAARRVRKGGAIVNFSTSVTKIAAPGYTAYAATKGAVDAMTLILAKEMRGRDVTVNAVAPGPDRHAAVLRGQVAGGHRPGEGGLAAGAARRARRHRRGRRVPRRSGALGQRPGHLRQRWRDLDIRDTERNCMSQGRSDHRRVQRVRRH